MNMNGILLTSNDQLIEISEKQVKEYNFSEPLQVFMGKDSILEKIKSLGLKEEDCTVLSLIDDEGDHYWVYEGYRYVNNIGYYLLIGNYTLPKPIFI